MCAPFTGYIFKSVAWEQCLFVAIVFQVDNAFVIGVPEGNKLDKRADRGRR